jgi:hypothetical protein
MTGWPLPATLDVQQTLCTQLIDQVVRDRIRPEYVVLNQFHCSDFDVWGNQCHQLCKRALTLVKRDGKPLYSVHNKYVVNMGMDHTIDNEVFLTYEDDIVFKLNEGFTPF